MGTIEQHTSRIVVLINSTTEAGVVVFGVVRPGTRGTDFSHPRPSFLNERVSEETEITKRSRHDFRIITKAKSINKIKTVL